MHIHSASRGQANLVMMTARTVHVAVRDFFFSRFAHFLNFNVERQILSRERVVAINRHHVALDLSHRHHARASIGLHLKLHSDLDVRNAAKRTTRYFLDQRLVVLTVRFGCDNLHLQLVAGLFALELTLQSWNEIAIALEVRERIAASRRIERFALVVREGVMNRYDGVLSDLHGYHGRFRGMPDYGPFGRTIREKFRRCAARARALMT
jgi:hypothetical protein